MNPDTETSNFVLPDNPMIMSDVNMIQQPVSLSTEAAEVYEPSAHSYDEVFPALPESDNRETHQSANLGQWSRRMKVNSSVITQLFHVPEEERRFRDVSDKNFGDQGEQAKICADIMQRTGARIEICSSKDQSLTILITGKYDSVIRARRGIVNELQTQANTSLVIPKEHHRFILGKSGLTLRKLEVATDTKISIPPTDDTSDLVKIVGTKEGIDRARHEIQLISDEQAKQALERLHIPKMYHPFISGPHGILVSELCTSTGARIRIPPLVANKDEIIVSGEKEGVAIAKEKIMKIYEEKKRKCASVSVEVKKSQHKYVIGSRGSALHEILAQTGVSVEIPPSDSVSETITLHGEQDKLGPALTLVYAKANSVIIEEVIAPSWLHKFIIGKQGSNINQVTQNLPKVHVEFTGGEDKIKIEGPPEDVERVKNSLSDMVKDLESRIAFEELNIEPKYHRHIIGKNGSNVNRIKQDTGVLIHIPSDSSHSNVIRIEGNPAGVSQAKEELLELVHKMENEKNRDILIEQRFHRNIIGAKGEKIKEIRDTFNQVNVTFPEPGIKTDVVNIRGPKEDVDLCFKYMQQLNKEYIENNHQVEVPIFKQFHKNIIGKGGSTIKKIRDETETKIELPAEGSDSDVIIISGKKENVNIARDRIQTIQNELANIITMDVAIPAKYHNLIIGAKGRLIRSIADDCGGVHIRFPQEGSGSDKVTVRGPKEDVEKAKKQLVELANEKQLNNHTAEIRARPEHHKFLIGRNGANIRRVRDKTGARIVFPSEKDEDKEIIVIVGKKESVNEAKSELEILIKDLDNIVEGEINVDPKYHRHFVARKGLVLRDIADENGGVTVSFPRNGCNSERVILKGAKDCVESAKTRILQIVTELESMVTIECIISKNHHRTVMGAKGYKVQGITQDYDVQIKFPDREIEPEENGIDGTTNGDLNDENSGTPKICDIIKISGKLEKCEAAKEALLALVPVTVDMNIPYDLHRFIIGSKGKDVREMMEKCDVNIDVPPANAQSDCIKIRGPPANVEKAVETLTEKVSQLEIEKQDRALRSFHLTVDVDPKYHPKIIGRKGAVITKIRTDHQVQIQFPERGSENESLISITGYEKNTEAARDDILKIVHELEDMISEEFLIDNHVHSRLIGSRGRNIRKIMDQFKVDIRFPRDTDTNRDTVIITGGEDNVAEAKDHLLNLEEEYMQDIKESEWMQQYTAPPSRHDEKGKRGNPNNKGFVVKGGPLLIAKRKERNNTNLKYSEKLSDELKLDNILVLLYILLLVLLM
ncbi:Vigilin [Nymphon striatum]|nr:Vigilin [Nymphon striatum]